MRYTRNYPRRHRIRDAYPRKFPRIMEDIIESILIQKGKYLNEDGSINETTFKNIVEDETYALLDDVGYKWDVMRFYFYHDPRHADPDEALRKAYKDIERVARREAPDYIIG